VGIFFASVITILIRIMLVMIVVQYDNKAS